jgi:hypothetical protein
MKKLMQIATLLSLVVPGLALATNACPCGPVCPCGADCPCADCPHS